MTRISANVLKTKGISAIESALAEQPEVMISVGGKNRFVVMDIARYNYNYLCVCELEAALAEARADLAEGRFVKDSPEDNLARLDKLA